MPGQAISLPPSTPTSSPPGPSPNRSAQQGEATLQPSARHLESLGVRDLVYSMGIRVTIPSSWRTWGD